MEIDFQPLTTSKGGIDFQPLDETGYETPGTSEEEAIYAKQADDQFKQAANQRVQEKWDRVRAGKGSLIEQLAYGATPEGMGRTLATGGKYLGGVGKGAVIDLGEGRLPLMDGQQSEMARALLGQKPEIPSDTGLAGNILANTGEAAGELAPAMVATRLGVPPSPAFASYFGLKTYGETGDPLEAAKQAMLGAVMPPVAKAGGELGERLALKLPIANETAGALAVGAGKLTGTQVALNSLMVAADSPEIVQELRTDPAKARERLVNIVGVNLAFQWPEMPHEIRDMTAKNSVEQFMASPEYRSLVEQEAAKGGPGLDFRPIQTPEAQSTAPATPGSEGLENVSVGRERRIPVEVPEGPNPPRETASDEIRRNDARTIAQIQAIFPEANLTREQARVLRNAAWGKPAVETPKPEEPNAIPKPSPGEILSRQPEEVREAGDQSGGVGQGEQGIEAPGETGNSPGQDVAGPQEVGRTFLTMPLEQMTPEWLAAAKEKGGGNWRQIVSTINSRLQAQGKKPNRDPSVRWLVGKLPEVADKQSPLETKAQSVAPEAASEPQPGQTRTPQADDLVKDLSVSREVRPGEVSEPKAVKDELISKLEEAQSKADGEGSIEVSAREGGTSYKVKNTKEAIGELIDKLKKLPTNPGTGNPSVTRRGISKLDRQNVDRLIREGGGETGEANSLRIMPPGFQHLQTAAQALNRRRLAFQSLFNARAERKEMVQTLDAADNQADITGQQARKGIEIGATKLDREAVTAIIEAKGDENRLNDFLNQARTGKNERAFAAVQHAIRNWTRLQPLANRVKAVLDRQNHNEQAAGIDTDYVEGYIPHVYDRDLWMGAQAPYVIGGGGTGIRTGFKKGRTFETIFDAIEQGYVPKTIDAGQLVEHRVKAGERLINRKAWADALRGVDDPSTKTPVVTGVTTRQKPNGKSFEVVPKGYTAMQIIPGVRVAVHDGYVGLFKAITGESAVAANALGKTVLEIEGGLKHGLLLFDTFHASRIMQKQLFLTGRIQWEKGVSLLEYSDTDLNRAVTENLITPEIANWIRVNRPTADLLLKAGLNVGRIQEAMYTSIVDHIPGVSRFNKWVFQKVTRGAMMESALHEFDRIKSQDSQRSDKDVALQVARDLNVYYGNLGRQGAFKSKTFQDMARLAFLAPQWVEGMARTEVRGAGQIGKAPVTGKMGSLGKGLGAGLVAYLVGTQLINLITRKHFTWDNPESNHKLDAWIPSLDKRSKGYFLSPLSVVAELTHSLLKYYPQEGAAGSVSHLAANKRSPLFLAGATLATGKDPITGDKLKDSWDRAKQAAVYLVPKPIAVETSNAPGARQQRIMGSLGFKTEKAPTNAQEINRLAHNWMQENKHKEFGDSGEAHPYVDFRKAIAAQDDKAITDALAKLRETHTERQIIEAMRTYSHSPFTGSRRNEIGFRQTLNPAQQTIYKDALQEKKGMFKQGMEALKQNRRGPRVPDRASSGN